MLKTISTLMMGIFATTLFALPVNAQTTVGGFSDVTTETRYNDAVAYVKAEGIVDGYTDGTYRPNQPITRGEFIKIIIASAYDAATIDACIRSDANLNSSTTVYFPDVAKSDVFAKYICIAKRENIVNGYTDGRFGMNDFVTFSQASKIAVKAMMDSEINGDVNLDIYVDILTELNAIPGEVQDRSTPLTRLQMAELIYRIRAQQWDRDRAERFLVNAPTIQIDQAFNLNTNKLVRIDGTRSFLKFVSVTEDSRCPEGTTCVWQGQAKLLMLYYDLDTKMFRTFELIIDEGNTDLARNGVGGYVFVANSLSEGISSVDGSGYTAYQGNFTISRMIR